MNFGNSRNPKSENVQGRKLQRTARNRQEPAKNQANKRTHQDMNLKFAIRRKQSTANKRSPQTARPKMGWRRCHAAWRLQYLAYLNVSAHIWTYLGVWRICLYLAYLGISARIYCIWTYLGVPAYIWHIWIYPGILCAPGSIWQYLPICGISWRICAFLFISGHILHILATKLYILIYEVPKDT